MSSSLPSTGILGGPLGLVTDGLLGPLLSEESPTTPAEAPIGTCTWLLDLQIGGRVLRYATRSVTVYDTQGRAYLYRGGLTDFAIDLDGYQESQGFEIKDRRIDWAQLAAMGENLARAQGILRHWEPGQLLEGAMIVLQGLVSEPEYAGPGHPETFVATLKTDVEKDRVWPDPQAAVNTSTWNRSRDTGDYTYDENIEGAVYQTIFGYPGEGDEVADPPVPCVPVYLVKWNGGVLADRYVMIGQGVLDCAGQEVCVRSSDPSGYLAEWLPAFTTTDKLGQTITAVNLDVATGMDDDVGLEFYAAFSRASGKGGGNTIPGGTRPMETLTDVALFCLRHSRRKVDLQAQEAQRRYLDRYHIDGALNEAVELVPWFESELMPLFPLVRARTERGLYWRFVNWWATQRDAVAHLDADAGQVSRASSIRVPEDQIANWFRIEFQIGPYGPGSHRVLTDRAEKQLPWYAHPDGLADERIIGSPVCARSQAVYGICEAEIIETPFLWRETTAVAVLEHLAVRDAFPRRPVAYTGPARDFRHLQRGDVVTVTDRSAHLDRAVAIVDAVRLSSARLCTLSLELLDPRRLG